MPFIGYRMTHDSGFAPNPFFGALTLATCKPAIRRTKKVGDWVAGFVSRALVNNCKNERVDSPPYQGLVYLMRVGEVMTLGEYFEDPRYVEKRPIKNNPDQGKRSGDNIYQWVNAAYRQLPNNSHDDDIGTIDHDTSGVNVLIADMEQSYYFGRNSQIPDDGWESIGFSLSKGRTFYCSDEDLQVIRNFLFQKGFGPGIHGTPCLAVAKEEESPSRGCSRK